MQNCENDFITEAREHLNVLEQIFLSLENAGGETDERERLDHSLRLVHSLKGDAGFLGYTAIRTLANAMETVLEALRDNKLPQGAASVETLLIARDRLASFLDDLEHGHEAELAEVLAQLELITPSPAPATRHNLDLPPDSARMSQENAISLSINLGSWAASRQRGLATLLAELDAAGRFDQPQLTGVSADLECLSATGVVLRGILRTSLSQEEIEKRLRLPSRRLVQAEPHTKSVPRALPAAVPATPLTAVGADADKTMTLRIQVELLDRLMTLIGELTLVRNQSLLVFGEEAGRPRPILQRLNGVTSELQETVLRTRMQPVGNLFGKFPRVVRDLGRQLGKQVEVTIVGREVELDKTILEQLSDPLTHLVRNSVDHGIETPEQRIAQGKPPTGQIALTARHGDGQVHIEIRDDGRGINSQAVRAKALAMHIKSESELDRMSQRELMGLILLPGFSTAGRVTDVSGRGVGLDVVKTNLESLEGTLTIDSQQGVGTTMTLRVPLTLAIIPCLMIVVSGDRYAVPQREVVEVVCLHPHMPGRLEEVLDTEVYRLRERLLPIVRLREVLRRPQPFSSQTRAEILQASEAGRRHPAGIQYLVVVRHEGKHYGLLVDEVRGTEEIVVKPMQATMKRIKIFSGATIMGDGRVALITNVAGIIQHARVSFAGETAVGPPKTVRDAAEAHRLLLFEYGPQEQFALPLLQIRRVETFDPARIERVGEHEYVTVDGSPTRILRLDRLLNVTACESSPLMHLVLAKFAREPVGILISRIVDSDSLSIELKPSMEQGPGVLGAAVVRNRLTLFLDIHYLVEQLLGAAPAAARAKASRQFKVLLIDDTPFFREAVGRYLTGGGFAVSTAVDGQDGLDKMTQGSFDLIVCDIEMPVMDGWEFARQVRQQGFRGPLLALSSLSKPQHEDRAKACGFDHYEEKLDPHRLVQTVHQLLAGHGAE